MRDHVIETFGIEKAIKRLKRYQEAGAIAAEKAAIACGKIILKESLKLCPIDTGELRASGHIVIEGYGFDIRVTVGYSAPHAIYVHENLEVYHKYPTQAKFLSEVIRRYRGDIRRMIAQQVHEAMQAARNAS